MTPWTAAAKNRIMPLAVPPGIARMKTNLSMSTVLRNRWLGRLALLAFLLLTGFGITEPAAQLKNRKRITSLQIGEGAEGSRVTVVADSALNDYEAFRRGDRFYVRIPVADFTAAQPGFRGDGFEDVQLQKVGDSVVVSFKLQPGATARVDQRSNRLDVIFFSPSRMARNNAANSVPSRMSSGATRVTARTNAAPATQRRERDIVGPLPPGSPQTFSARAVDGASAERPIDGQRTLETSTQTGTANLANKRANDGSVSSTTSSQVDSSIPAPAAPPSYTLPTIVTPSVTEPSRPSSAPVATGRSTWKTRGQSAVHWVSANRLVSLLGGLALLCLMGIVAFFLYTRGKKVVKAKRVKTPGVQPKYTHGLELEDMLAGTTSDPVSNVNSGSFVDEFATRRPNEQSSAAPLVVQKDFSEASGRVARPIGRAAAEGVVARPQSRWVPTRPSLGPAMSGAREGIEDQEREVFEL